MKIGVFGDVHGCVDEMKFIVSSFINEGVEKLISLGDLTDRGPDSPGTVEFWEECKSYFKESIMIRGNHDDKILRIAKHTRSFLFDGRPIPINMSKAYDWQITQSQNGQMISWLVGDERGEKILKTLSDSVLFHQHGSYAFVHGGIPPNIQQIPDEIHKMSDFMYCRYISDENHKMINFRNKDQSTHYFWAEKYDGRFGKVFFGHQPHMPDEVFKYKNCVAMDTGCVFGGVLTGIVLEDTTGEMKLIQKSPAMKYAERINR